jgi:DNA mismatch repair protein MutL
MDALVEGRYNFADLPSHTKELYTEEAATPYGNARYVGRAFELFILVEKGGRLYAVDQHAAHERILYDRALSAPVPKQELLVPIPFTTDCAEDDEFLRREKDSLAGLGVVIAADAVADAAASTGAWKIEALPVQWRLGDEDTVREILSLRSSGENIARRWAATIACHAAIRDGDIIDDDSALDIASQALELPIKCCPHGRPILFELKKDDFLRAVRRIK